MESKPLLPEDKVQAALSAKAPAKDGWSVSAAWLPLAALFGALCTLAVVSAALSGPNGWWLGAQARHRRCQHATQRLENLRPCCVKPAVMGNRCQTSNQQ